jgi:hypothetical protein
MDEIILLSDTDYQKDAELRNLITVPFELLDTSHPSLTKAQKRWALKKKYHDKLIADGLDTGLLRFNEHGEAIYQSRLSEGVFKGFVFEALLVRLYNDNPQTIGKTAYQWCTGRSIVNRRAKLSRVLGKKGR